MYQRSKHRVIWTKSDAQGSTRRSGRSIASRPIYHFLDTGEISRCLAAIAQRRSTRNDTGPG